MAAGDGPPNADEIVEDPEQNPDADRLSSPTMPEHADTPFESVVSTVRKSFGLDVSTPELRPDEEILWAKRANRIQDHWRAVGGRAYVTNRRLVFASHKFDARIGGEDWSVGLDRIVNAETRGLLRRVHVGLDDGQVERLVLPKPRESAKLIAAAGAAAREAAETA